MRRRCISHRRRRPPVLAEASRCRVASLKNGTAEDSPALKDPGGAAGCICKEPRARVGGQRRQQQRSGSCLLHGE